MRGLLGRQDEGLQMTKDEALLMCLEYIESDAHERKYVGYAIKAALKGQDGECKYCANGCPACDARKLLEQKPVAWGMAQPDGDILDVISPVEHARLEGGYTVPLYRQPQQDAQNKSQTTEQAHLLHITIQSAVNIERENCARLCDAYELPDVAQAIRARGHR